MDKREIDTAPGAIRASAFILSILSIHMYGEGTMPALTDYDEDEDMTKTRIEVIY
jgi:hypothetical protein